MINPIQFVPAPYRWLAYLALAAIIAGAGAWGGHKLTRAWYAPKLAKAEAARDEYAAAYSHLARQVQTQNAAIQAWEKEAASRSEKAAKAMAEAVRYRGKAAARAAALYTLQTPKEPENECEALRALIDLDRAHGGLPIPADDPPGGQGPRAGLLLKSTAYTAHPLRP